MSKQSVPSALSSTGGSVDGSAVGTARIPATPTRTDPFYGQRPVCGVCEARNCYRPTRDGDTVYCVGHQPAAKR